MKRIDLKASILEEGKKRHQSVIDDYRQEIKGLQESEMMVNDGQLDLSQLSYNNEMNDRINFLAEQLNFAVDEMNQLNRLIIREPLHNEVSLGSVVETDQRTFFVSVSIEEFQVGEREYFGLSQKTPLYRQMAGKKKGDTFSYRDRSYRIRNIF